MIFFRIPVNAEQKLLTHEIIGMTMLMIKWFFPYKEGVPVEYYF